MLTPTQFAADLRQQLAGLADSDRAQQMAAYMRDRFAFFGIQTPARRAAVKGMVAILVANLGHPDFFIRKAMGWALRQFARHDPDWVQGWLQAQGDGISPLTRREALKHL